MIVVLDEWSLCNLMTAAQRGDKQAYAALLEAAKIWLERFYARRVPQSERDDLVQEVLIALHNKRATYDSARPFLPWLAAIARYRWVDYLRRVYRSERAILDGSEVPDEVEGDVTEARLSLERLFEYLPSNQITAIELVKIEGFSIREASDRSGQSEALVKVNIHRGLRKLSALIEKAN